MKTPFLRQVAQYFRDKEDLSDYCFVMPNHRSCKFMERELEKSIGATFVMPEMLTISDFVTSLSKRVLVSPVEAVFVLYDCYRNLPGNDGYMFDKFVYWGNVLLGDFNDVDMYLVDPEQIFSNIKDLREIQSNYIDADLRDIVSRYFKMSVEGSAGVTDDFWLKNYEKSEDGEAEVKAEYMRLWESMLTLYKEYNKVLEERGLSSMGHIYREAVLRVKEGKDLGHKKYVFVGFNVLSTSEIAIFKRLANRGKALFFWDAASPAFDMKKYPGNPGGKFVKFFQKEFPEPSDFVGEQIETFPSIEVVGMPSNVGQAKYAFEIVSNIVSSDDDKIDTALVLPDETLFVPLLNSIGDDIKVNVTMGYPLQSSDIASLMRIVARMHRQARRDDSLKLTYYREDVKTVLSHPIIKSCFGADALNAIREIDEKNLFAVPQELMQDTSFEMLFTTLEDNSNESVRAFLKRLMDFCGKVREAISTGDNEADDGSSAENKITLQEAFINQYVDVLNKLDDMLALYKVPPCESTLFYLVDRLANIYSVPFEGEPLQGLQVMGMLETRCLDFENVIILSANERVLPRKARGNSFISEYMRRAYHMSTVADQEQMWAYYFYRFISRANKVYMLHDTSTQSMGSEEVSRYVLQLEKVYGCDVKHKLVELTVPVQDDMVIEVPKQMHVVDEINAYKAGVGERCLSASSINEYINCQLEFYLDCIERLRGDDGDVDFMDYSTLGTIVHNTLQQLYYPDVDGKKRTGEYKVTCAMIKEFQEKQLDWVLTRMINKEYVRSAKLDEPLVGEASIVSVVIKNYVEGALRYDRKLLNNIDSNYFTVLECEKKHNVTLEYGGVDFNFVYTADRIDRIAGSDTVRIVDYKTGKDVTAFSNMEQLFSIQKDRRKAVLQLLLYCNAYAIEEEYDGPIQPVIYKLRNMDEAGVKYGKNLLEDYKDVNDKFEESMDELMDGFFDLTQPYVQADNSTPSTSPCRYCKFANFCRR